MSHPFYVIELSKDTANRWPLILDWAVKNSNLVEFAVARNDLVPNSTQYHDFPSYPEVKSLQADCLEYQSKHRWFTEQLGKTNFIRLKLTVQIINLLKRVGFLNEWLYTGLEDPSFYSDDKVIMWTICHEGRGLIFLDLSSKDDMDYFESLGFVLAEKIEL